MVSVFLRPPLVSQAPTSPLARVAPGQSGLVLSWRGMDAKSKGSSTAPFHGRFMRCGDTKTLYV